MNPRVSRSVGAGLQGDRLPDRQDRRPARHRLHPRRDPQRHHRRDPGQLRARAGLRRGQGAAVRVREVPGRRPGADHAHEVGRRGDGDRPQLPRGAAEGAALAGEPRRPAVSWRGAARRPRRSCSRAAPSRTTAGCARVHQALRAGASVADLAAATGIDPWFVDQILGIEEHAERLARRRARPPRPGPRRCCAAAKRAGLLRRARSAQLPGMPEDAGRGGCGTRSASGPSTTRSTPAPPSSPPARRTCTRTYDERDRGPAGRPAEGDHPRQRAEPDRPGHRVRLRLRARLVRAVGGRLRDRDGQLQPGDRVHRLRHLATGCTSSRSPSRTCSRWCTPSRRAGRSPG